MSFKIKDFFSQLSPVSEFKKLEGELLQSQTILQMNPDFIDLGLKDDGFFRVSADEEDLQEGDVRELGSDEGHHSPIGNEFEQVHRHLFI